MATEGYEPGGMQQRPAPASAHVADRRGLTAAGAVTLALAFGALGAAIDVVTGSGLRSVFAVAFVLGCGLAAALAHREDLIATVVTPPLAYVVLAIGADLVERAGVAGSWLNQQLLELVTSLVTGAPVLLTATGVALVIALFRGVGHRARSQRVGAVRGPARQR